MALPSILLAVICMIFNADGTNLVLNMLTRFGVGHLIGLFVYCEALTPWIYLPMTLVYPAALGAAYTFGPKVWAKQQEQMEKAKREKRRKVNRRRKKKTA